MKTWAGALTVCCAIALPLAGCGGGDDDNGGSGGSGGSTTTEQSTAPTSTGGGASVTMKDIKFNPSQVKIKAGQTVTWTNEDSGVGHDVTAASFKSGAAGGIEGGQTFQHTFKNAGTFSYVCTVHPGMKGTVVVTK
jgi:plastocyanin